MSLFFNSIAAKNGIIQTIERRLFGRGGYGQISGDADQLASFTAEVNLALDKALSIILAADGRWQFDDSNHSGYPIITTNLVQGQRDYSFTTDGASNLILEIAKAAILPSATATLYQELTPVDVQSGGQTPLLEGSTVQGVPYEYDKTANAIFLDPIPSYNATNGLKLYINREASYFTVSDTTKMPGFAGIFHEYLALVPSYVYARDNSIESRNSLKNDILEMEEKLEAYYTHRNKDERVVMRPRITGFR